MKIVEKSARTVDEAVDEALAELGVDQSKVEVEVVDEGNKGLLGFLGGRSARVRVIYRQSPAEAAVTFLKDFFHAAAIRAEVAVVAHDDTKVLEISGGDLGALIGRRGQALDSLQYLVNVAVNRQTEEKQRLIVDVEGYRQRREEALQRLALRMAEKVRRERRKAILEPMTPQERRIIHSTLQNVSDVSTFSEGEDPYRRVVISPNNRE